MTSIYIDSDCKCHAVPGDGLTAVETDFFDGREREIENYRLVPEGQTWVRADGAVFVGQMIAPHGSMDGQVSAAALLAEIEEALNG